jgi:penicillin-binding protein 1A
MFIKKWWQILILATLVFGLVAVAMVGLAATLIYPALPSLEALKDYQPKVPMRVYTEDGKLIGEFGEERRAFIPIQDVPVNMKNAILAIEDRRFYTHGGIDFHGIIRAGFNNITGRSHEGASTITTQVAKNFFSHGERNLKTKVYEFCLAVKIEHTLTKDKILELYVNQIFLGQRAYGFAAASQVYYGKPLKDLNLAESALLAGLPKAPSNYNPFSNLKRAESRQHEVLHDMYRFGFIDEATYDGALKQPLRFKVARQSTDLKADYVAEIVRQTMYERYQDAIYSSGIKVYTTIIKSNQEAANAAVIKGLLEYDERHGYHGPEKYLSNTTGEAAPEWMDKALDDFEVYGGLVPAIVSQANLKLVTARTKFGKDIQISADGLKFVISALSDKAPEKQRIRAGSLIRVMPSGDGWKIVQLPQAESSLIAVDSDTGAVRALVGGFDFNRNKFNHVTQAWRQPGSSFKPFIYSAALEKGFTAASVVDDAPISFPSSTTGDGTTWEPHNFDDKYDGPIRLRTALTKSKNMVSIRLLNSIGTKYAQDYITRFGFSPKDHPPYLTMALGAGSVSAWQMAGAYSVFANGGYKIKPYLIKKIVDRNGAVIEQAEPLVATKNAERVLDARNAFIMTSMMQDVARIGTAARARQLGRSDLAGKTGTTNSQVDTWFAGYNPKQVAIVWMGYDKPQSLGKNETGGHAALPIWIDYMAVALRGVPDNPLVIPDGIVSVKINPGSGTRAAEDASGVYEYFYDEFQPRDGGSFDGLAPDQGAGESDLSAIPHAPAASASPEPTKPEQLF